LEKRVWEKPQVIIEGRHICTGLFLKAFIFFLLHFPFFKRFRIAASLVSTDLQRWEYGKKSKFIWEMPLLDMGNRTSCDGECTK
jgi:hypothetical protein